MNTQANGNTAMTAEEINIARAWLNTKAIDGKPLTDEQIEGIVAGTSMHRRIQLRIAFLRLRAALFERFGKCLLGRLFLRLFWRLYIVRLSLGWIRQCNIGDRVWYKGKRYYLYQGVKSPIWGLTDGTETFDVHSNEFRRVQTPAAWWGSFHSGYRFYMLCWYSIWVRQGVEPWMLGCDIWPKNWKGKRK